MILPDVIAMVADGMATQGGLYLADVKAMGWWNYHWSDFISNLVLRCSTEPHPRCVQMETCLHFYSGMDC